MTVTHRQAVESAKILNEYCQHHDCHKDCVFIDIDHCNFWLSDREMHLAEKELKRLEKGEVAE